MSEKFADESDRATAIEEAERGASERAIRLAANSKHRDLVPVGTCYYCGEDVRPDQIFCDRDCGSGYDQLQAARKRNGR